MAELFSSLVEYLNGLLGWLLDGVVWLLKSVFFMLLDGFLTVVTLLFQTLDFSSLLASYAMNWAGLPSQAIYLIVSIGIPQGLTIVASAMLVRLGLNIIPAAFTRV